MFSISTKGNAGAPFLLSTVGKLFSRSLLHKSHTAFWYSPAPFGLAVLTLTRGCLKVHGGVPIVLCLFGDPL